MNIFDKAVAAGFAPVPIEKGTKSPLVAWGDYKHRKPTAEETASWVDAFGDCWVAIACGAGSDGLEVMDFDVPGKGTPIAPTEAPAYEPWVQSVRDHMPEGFFETLVVVGTPSGGRHVYFRRSAPKGNTKLASTQAREVLIETRGQGGYVLAPPTDGYAVIQGKLTAVPTIDDDVADALHTLARCFNEAQPVEYVPPVERPKVDRLGASPLDDFDARGSWGEALPGWQFTGRKWSGRQEIRRPGTQNDCSGVVGMFDLGERALIFTTSTPLPNNKALTKSACYAYLQHNGDFAAAAKALRAKGFGSAVLAPSTRRALGQLPEDGDVDDEPEAGDELPRIQVNARQLSAVTADAVASMVVANDPPTVFARDRSIVRIVRDSRRRMHIDTMTSATVRESLSRSALWYRINKDGKPTECFPPREVCENLLSLPETPAGLDPLEGLAMAPILRPDGTVFEGPGYDPESGWIVADEGGFVPFDGDGAAAAAWVLEDLFGDFPFVDAASRANALGLFLLPFVRPAIDGPTPLWFGDAPRSRSGKTKLLQCALVAGTGEIPATEPIPDKEEEIEKKLFAYICEGRQVVFFDNMRGELQSAALEAMLTARSWTGRILGTSQSATAPIKSIVLLTANNGKMSVDLAGRAIWIRIDPRMEDPTERTGFRHADLEGWAIDNRKRLIGAAIAMLRQWIEKGKPEGSRVKASYVQFSKIVGGVLEACGIEGFLSNDKALKAQVNDEDDMWGPFYQEWFDQHEYRPTTTSALAQMAIEKGLLAEILANAKSERGIANMVGKALRSRIDVVYHGLTIRSAPKMHGYPRLQLVPVGESSEAPFTQGLNLGVNEVNLFDIACTEKTKVTESTKEDEKRDFHIEDPQVNHLIHPQAQTGGDRDDRAASALEAEDLPPGVRRLPDGTYAMGEE